MNTRDGRLGKDSNPKSRVKACGLLVLRLDDDRKDGERAGGGKDSADRVGEQHIADPLTGRPLVAREAADQREGSSATALQHFRFYDIWSIFLC